MQNLPYITGAIPDKTSGSLLYSMLKGVYDRLSSMTLSTPGLVIKAGSSALAKCGTLCKVVANGILVSVAANTDCAALSGVVTNAKFNVFCFFVDGSGVITTLMGREGASLGAVSFPPIQEKKAMLGFVIINPTGTGNFTGGTTPLDDATVVPNAVYVNTVGSFDPTALI